MPTPTAAGTPDPPTTPLDRLVALLQQEPDPQRALSAMLEWVAEEQGAGGAAIRVDDPWNPGRPLRVAAVGLLDRESGVLRELPLTLGNECIGTLELFEVAGSPATGYTLPPASVLGLMALHLRATLQTFDLRRHALFARCSEQIVSRMAAGRPEAELFDTLTRCFAEIFALDRVSVFTIGEDRGWLNPEAVYDSRQGEPGHAAHPADPALHIDEDPHIGPLFREGRLIEIPDVANAELPPLWRELARDREVGGIVGLPLADNRGPWGLLILAQAKPGPVLAGSDRELARLLLQQLAPLLQNSRMLRQQQRHLESFRALLDSSRELSAVLDLWEIPRRVAMKGMELAEADEGVLFILEEDRVTLKPAFAVSDDEESLMARAVPLGQGLVGRVAESRRGAYVNRACRDARELRLTRATASRLAVPLVCADELVGVLLLHRLGGREFGDFELAMATVFATQAAIALENARLFQGVTNERTRLATMIEQLEEAVFFCDAEGVILLVNPAAHRWLSRPEAIEGAGLIELVTSEVRAELAGAAAELRSGQARNVTREIAMGARVDLVSLTAIHDIRRQLTGFVVLVKDISVMKAIESQLMQSSKMSAVGQLASGVAHEFNNLITAISGYAQLMRDSTDERLRRKGVDIILASSERARQLTHNLLTFSRDRGDQAQRVELNHLIEESLLLVEQQLRADGIKLVREAGELEETWAQRGPLQEVFLNLMTNARHALLEKFDGRGGTLVLRTRQEGETLIAEVIDDGVGIPPDRINRIFDPFFTTKGPLGGRATPGTGLGLYSVYNVVTAHGGRIDVESRPGLGATFRLSLPLRRSRPVAQAA